MLRNLGFAELPLPFEFPVVGPLGSLKVFVVRARNPSDSRGVEKDEKLEPSRTSNAMISIFCIDGGPLPQSNEVVDIVVQRLATGVSMFSLDGRREDDLMIVKHGLLLASQLYFSASPKLRIVAEKELLDGVVVFPHPFFPRR